MKIKDSPHPYAMLTSLLWSLAYVLTRICVQYLDPLYVSSIRSTIAAITLLIIVLVTGLPKPKLKDLKWFILSGACGITIYMICFNKGASTVTTATGNVMLAISPVIIAVVARILFKEKLSPIQWIAIVVSFVGVVMLTVLSGGLTVNIGLLWLLIAVIVLSIYNLLQKHLSKSYPSLTITAFSFIIGALGLSGFIPSAVRALPGVPIKVYFLLVVLGCCCSAIAYGVWTIAFSKTKNSSTVTNYMFINPFISALIGWVVIGDPIERSAIWGGGVIMIGLFLFNFGPGLLRRLGGDRNI